MKAGVTRCAEMLPVLTVAGLIRHYERSPEFNRLSGSTQRTYGYALRKIADGLGAAPVDDVQPRDFAGLLALMGDAAGSVNITRRVMSALYTWGKRKHRSEEHTSELQSLMRISYAVFCLKKKKKT